MSVKERLAELQKQEAEREAAEKEAKRKAEQERTLAFQKNYEVEVEKTTRIHAYRLEELRQKGVVPLIEEAVNHPILPLRAVKDGKYAEWIAAEPSPEEIDKEHKAAMNRIEHGPYTGWQAEVLNPDISRETLVGDKSLKIRIFREHFRYQSFVVNYTNVVKVEFSPDKQLRISGEKLTYNDTVPTDLAIIKQAIAQAMFKPAAVGRQSPRHPIDTSNILYRTPIGAA